MRFEQILKVQKDNGFDPIDVIIANEVYQTFGNCRHYEEYCKFVKGAYVEKETRGLSVEEIVKGLTYLLKEEGYTLEEIFNMRYYKFADLVELHV